jgi:hypothetical protein
MRMNVLDRSRRLDRLMLASAAVVLLAGCSRGEALNTPQTASVLPSVSPPAPSGAPTTAVSDRFGYRFVIPAGWGTAQATLDWDIGNAPHKNSPSFDTYTTLATDDPWIVVSRRAAEGAPLDQWIRAMSETRTISYGPEECRPVEDERATTLDGESARLRGFHCPIDGPNAIAVQILARHHADGWIFECYSEKAAGGALPAFEQQCQQWASTLRFGS